MRFRRSSLKSLIRGSGRIACAAAYIDTTLHDFSASLTFPWISFRVSTDAANQKKSDTMTPHSIMMTGLNARADSFQKNVGKYFKQEVPDEE